MSQPSATRPERALLAALKTDNPDIDEYPERYLRWVAARLARALESDETGQFADRVRAVCFNLPKPHNHERRRALCNRTAPPSSICGLRGDSWASSDRRAERRAESARRLRQRIVTDTAAVRTRAVACGACGAMDAMATAVGDQRESRKGETWGSKDHEEASHRVRLQCNKCGAVWHGGDDALLFCDEEEEAAAAAASEGSGTDNVLQGPGAEAAAARSPPSSSADRASQQPSAEISPAAALAAAAAPAPAAAAAPTLRGDLPPPSRAAGLRGLRSALLRAAGRLGAEHDAFLGSSPEELSARLEEEAWRRAAAGAAQLPAHVERLARLARAISSGTLDRLATGELGLAQLLDADEEAVLAAG